MATVTRIRFEVGLRARAGVARLRRRLKESYDLFIGGSFVAPSDGTRVATVNPATEEPLAEVAFAGAERCRCGRGGRACGGCAVGRVAGVWSGASTCSGSRG